MSTDTGALDYHRLPVPGKIAVETTKSMLSQHDLSLAYSSGVAAVCAAIVANPESITDYTARGNLVAVITNGSAVLGLGDIGPHAAKPVMEGKGALFKAFAGIDVFDLELDETDPKRFAAAIALGVMKAVGKSVDIGPMLTGARYPVHILGNDVSVRGIVNMTALAAASA
jgi:malic enzyme